MLPDEMAHGYVAAPNASVPLHVYSFDSTLLRFVYRLQAKKMGWVAFDGSLRFHLLREAFRQTYGELETIDGTEFLRTTAGTNGGFLGYQRRPRVLPPDLQSQLDTLLIAGGRRDQIASPLGIRRAFIKDYLAVRPELKMAREQAHATILRQHHREHFLRVLDEYPGVPIKRIRRISDNGFEWLYRNDLEWLRTHLPGIWRRPS